MSKKTLVISLIVIILLGLSSFVYLNSKKDKTPIAYRIDNIRKIEPSKLREEFESVNNSNLDQEEKQLAINNIRNVIEENFDKMIDEYFTCPKDRRKNLLDKRIDEMEKREATSRPSDEQRKKWRERQDKMTVAERKLRFESISPDKQAKRQAYFQALQERMKERGIERTKP